MLSDKFWVNSLDEPGRPFQDWVQPERWLLRLPQKSGGEVRDISRVFCGNRLSTE